jgi:hypothetical protein
MQRARFSPLTTALTAFLAALGSSGCKGCSEEKPYTPFGTTTALPAPEPSAAATLAPSASASAAPVLQKAVPAPADSDHWQLGERTLEAPPGLVFDQALQASFGDPSVSTVTWLVPAGADAGPAVGGELWLFPAAGPPKKLTTLPGFVPSGPGCKLVTVLARTGAHTVTLDARGECTGALIARSPVRALVVVAPERDAAELMSLRIAAPAPGEVLDFTANTLDRDGDGRDDIEVDVTGGAVGSKLALPLVWLDRTAGTSRDAAEPGRTLARLAGHEAGRAKTKKVADEVVKNVADLRRLMASLCAESATPRVLDADGDPLACAPLTPVVDSLATAEVTAELTGGHVLEAFGALARDGWYFGKASTAVRQKLERAVLDAVEPVTAVVKPLEPRPSGLERTPRLSPLSFDATGGLLVQTVAGLVRTEPDGSSPSPPAPAARSLEVVPAPGQRWVSTTFSCDRSEVTLGLEGAPPLVTGLLSPRPGACGHAPFFANDVPPVLAAGGGKLAAIVGGARVGDATGAPVMGGARSENGTWTVVPTSFGLLVDGPAHRLVSLGPSVPAPATLTDCVVNGTGKTAACVQKRTAILIQLP